MTRKTIGIYGGSFNPIHMGHITLARQILREGLLDEVWLLVSPQNPLKSPAHLLPDEIRLEMTRRAVSEEEGLSVSDIEFHLPKPSYTWNTLQALRKRYPEVEWALLIGSDNWDLFHQWYRHEDILREYRVIIYPRKGTTIEPGTLPPHASMAPTPLIDISSTEIRKRVSEGASIHGMIPAVIENDVLRYYTNHKQTRNG